MISYEHKCIFIHIPRTGGTSIEDLIWPDRHSWNAQQRALFLLWSELKPISKEPHFGLRHLFAKDIKKEVDDKVFTKFWKFTIVRNPWDKIVSQYLFIRRTLFLPKNSKLRKFIGLKKTDDLKAYLSLIQDKLYPQWVPQWRFFIDGEGKCLVNTIYRFEDFKKTAKDILGKLGIRKNIIPHINKTERTHYHDYYDDESREIVAKIYAKDIELLGYQF